MKIVYVAHVISWYFCGAVMDAFVNVCKEQGIDYALVDSKEFPNLKASDADMFLCADSSEWPDFTKASSPDVLKKTAMWYSDSRINCTERSPGDDYMAMLLDHSGGWVFQGTTKDVERVQALGVKRVSWLPFAADPRIWLDTPKEAIQYRTSFVGNLYENYRAGLIENLQKTESLFWPGQIGAVTTEAAGIYRRSGCGFNAPTFYKGNFQGRAIDHGINMRVFEVQSCGVPLVTNTDDDLVRLGFHEHTITYSDPSEIPNCLSQAIERRDELGAKGSEVIRSGHTYEHRVRSAFDTLKNA